jgi:hypothetical protein
MSWQPLADIRTWLQTNPTLIPLLGGRVWFRIPDNAATYPLARLYRAGGGFQAGEAPVMDLRVGIDVWGAPVGSADGTYAQTDQATVAVETALFTLASQTVGGTVLYGAQPSGSPFNPDPDDGAPRFTITATVTCGPA